ncbi:hypothetical protein GCM10009785_10050 [Brooklawnia cerclae]|uniref:DUF2304 domain-containing protein n=1 Tax=Brooklawnia cerclae TaxID=349934 RepID=A0ABX0SI40_9ACTN|nr:DUF2304 domain-containing protein [Brooklawnia cerclae]NIH58068.1 hypothetical protein [Brooklawnia cerclae]
MRATIFFLVVAVVTLVFLFNLVRSRRLREKYVALWMVTAVVIIVLALFPDLLGWLASLAGIAVPSNLLFALAILLLFGVSLQLSLEISRAEDKTRVLAENVAILNLQLRELRGQGPKQPSPLPADDQTPDAVPEPDRSERLP